MASSTIPLWQEALPSVPSTQPPRLARADVVVIGGGLAGLSAALHLLEGEPARRVILVEAGQLGSGASARSTGMLTPGVGQNLAGLVRRFGRDRARAMYQATLDAVSYVRELTAREGIDCELRMGGQLVVAKGRSGKRRVESLARLMDALELPHEALLDGALSERIRLRSRDGLRLPLAGTLHPGKLVAGLARAVLGRGGEIYENCAAADIRRGAPARVILASGGEIVAEQVVLATGGYGRFGFLRGRVLPLHLRLVLTRPLPKEALARIGWRGREGVIDSRRVFNYFRLTEDDRVLFGGGLPRYRFGGETKEDVRGKGALEALRDELETTFPEDLELVVERSWTGVIDYVVDTLPVVGRLRRHPRLISLSGWCGHGIALSLTAGQWVRHLVDRDEPPSSLPWFRDQAPLVPTELVRSVGIPLSSRALAGLDRI